MSENEIYIKQGGDYIQIYPSKSEWVGPFNSDAEALNALRETVAEILGYDTETWPEHKNAPLAIAAAIQLLKNRCQD